MGLGGGWCHARSNSRQFKRNKFNTERSHFIQVQLMKRDYNQRNNCEISEHRGLKEDLKSFQKAEDKHHTKKDQELESFWTSQRQCCNLECNGLHFQNFKGKPSQYRILYPANLPIIRVELQHLQMNKLFMPNALLSHSTLFDFILGPLSCIESLFVVPHVLFLHIYTLAFMEFPKEELIRSSVHRYLWAVC